MKGAKHAYLVDWESIYRERAKGFKMATILLIIGSSVILSLAIFSYIEGKLLPLVMSSIVFTIFVILIGWGFRYERNLRRYSFVKRIEFRKNGVIITTVENIRNFIRYEDVGLIDKTVGIKTYDYKNPYYPSTYYYSWITVIYYNLERGDCVKIYMDRDTGEVFVNKYLNYCKKRKIKPCPILDGIFDNYAVQQKARDKIMNSNFCWRRDTGRIIIPPPPWIMEDDRNEG